MSLQTPTLKTVICLVALLACTACKRTPVAQPPTPTPFHPAVRFLSYGGYADARQKIAETAFQVETGGGQNEFVRLDEIIPQTTIRLTDFDPATHELIVTDTTTNQRARIPLAKPVNSPPTF
jgi:hypothetical protein